MPVTATPAVNAPANCPAPPQPPVPQGKPAAVEECCKQNEVFPACPTYQGKDIRGRIGSVRVKVCQAAVVRWQMLNQTGLPLSLLNCTPDPDDGSSESSESSSVSVSTSSESSAAFVEGTLPTGDCGELTLRFRMREQLSRSECSWETGGTVEDTKQGLVRAAIPPEALTNPGVYYAEFGLYDYSDPDNPVLHWGNMFYLFVEPMVSLANLKGPPTLAEIRLSMRDSSPAENLLLDEARYSDDEIILAIRRPIDYWNSVPPPINTFTTANFPWREPWLSAIQGYLLRMAADQFRANQLAYGAGGVQVDDQNKEMQYERAAEHRLNEWKNFVRVKKASINLENAYGGIGSTYRFAGGGPGGY